MRVKLWRLCNQYDVCDDVSGCRESLLVWWGDLWNHGKRQNDKFNLTFYFTIRVYVYIRILSPPSDVRNFSKKGGWQPCFWQFIACGSTACHQHHVAFRMACYRIDLYLIGKGFNFVPRFRPLNAQLVYWVRNLMTNILQRKRFTSTKEKKIALEYAYVEVSIAE